MLERQLQFNSPSAEEVGLSNIRRVTQTGPEKRQTFINLDTIWHLQRSGKDEYTTVKFSDQHSVDIIETPEAVFKLAEKG
jgi:hypothetical protein